MVNNQLTFPDNSNGVVGSEFQRKLLTAILKPHKIPGYIKRQYERQFKSVEGSQIIWPEPGRAMMVNFGIPRPQQNQVLVLTNTTLVSPGTERANFNRMPNTQVSYPYAPGYSGAGTVVEVGSGVTSFKFGDRVSGAFLHASIALIEEDDLIPIPDLVNPEQACFVTLGVIALQGIRKAQLKFGEKIAVLGQGLIGQIITQLALASGAYPITAIAASKARLPLAEQCGAHSLLSLSVDNGRIDQVCADVTIEVSGNPEAIHAAIRCTRKGGRIILLGSPRGKSIGLDFELLREKELTMIGAHMASLPSIQSSPGWWTAKKEEATFLQLIAQGRIDVDLLISDEIYPPEAERFYRRLAWGDKSINGALFKWDQLEDNERMYGLLRQARSEGQAIQYIRSKLTRLAGRSDKKNDTSKILYTSVVENLKMQPVGAPLRMGMIGCGEIAVSNARAINASPNATISAVADVNEAVARDLAQEYNVPFSTSTDELLARKDVDAVLISVPHHLHAPLVIRAARAGKHIIVEKPMATTLAEADEMIAVARESGIHLATLYCQRYLPYVQQAKSLIDQGVLGRILGANILFCTDKPASYYTSGFSARVATDWRLSKEKSGGGVLIFNIVHYLDIFRYITGLEVIRVYSDYGALETPFETEDSICVTMRCNNQAIGSLTASAIVRGTPTTQLRIWGTDGQMILTEPSNHIFYSLRQIGAYKPVEWHSLGNLSTEGDREEFITRFAEAILHGETPEMTPESGRAIQAIVEAIYQSGKLQQPVYIS